MAWPTDTLSNANLNSGTDKPHLARPDLNALMLMVQSILGEAPAGSLLLTNQDEGAGNGIDADTVDGEHASAFANAAHNHDAGNITTGILGIARGGTGRGTSITKGAVLTGDGVGELIGVNGTSGQFLKSNGTGSTPSYAALPTFPTVDVHASDFYDTEINATGGSGVFDQTIDTGFGNNDFVYGVSGIRRSDGIADGITSGGIYDNEGFSLDLSGSGTVAAAAAFPAASAGQLRVRFLYSVGGSIGFRVKVWARKNI